MLMAKCCQPFSLKNFIVDAWQGPKYISEGSACMKKNCQRQAT